MEEDKKIKNFRDNIFNDDIIKDLIDNKKDFIQQDKNITYQITTSDNQKNNSNNNISSINLGTCEDILKDKYNIDKNLPLIIFKIDYYSPDTLIPIVGYEIYHPINKSKLDLTYCKDILIKLNIPTSIDENNLFKYDPNSGFYNDNCFSFTTEDGTDIVLSDRKKEYNDNNLSLCQNDCEYIEYNKDNKQSSCECGIKNEMDSISEIIDNPNKLSNAFNINETNSNFGSSNIITMKCTKALFSKDGLINNISSYIFFIFIFIFLLSILFFIKCGFPLLQNDINYILNSKKIIDKITNNKKASSNLTRINNSNNKNKKIITRKKMNFPPKKKPKAFNLMNNNNINFVNENNKNKRKKNLRSKFILNNNSKSLNLNKTIKKKKVGINKNVNNNINRNNILTTNNNNEEKIKLNFNDFELNTLKLQDAISYDKRTCFEYYISLIKTKHPIIFAFCPIKDFNLIIIKLCIFCLSFSLYYSVNYFFFDEKMIHKIYEDGGKYDIIYFLPKISIAFAASHVLSIIIRIIFLSERNIIQIKIQPDYSTANEIVPTVKRNLTIKYIIFFILGTIILIFFWMLLSSFGAVYQNTQVIVIENTLISFGLSFIYPFFINIFPCIFRICSMNSKTECLYIFSKILQIL